MDRRSIFKDINVILIALEKKQNNIKFFVYIVRIKFYFFSFYLYN